MILLLSPRRKASWNCFKMFQATLSWKTPVDGPPQNRPFKRQKLSEFWKAPHPKKIKKVICKQKLPRVYYARGQALPTVPLCSLQTGTTCGLRCIAPWQRHAQHCWYVGEVGRFIYHKFNWLTLQLLAWPTIFQLCTRAGTLTHRSTHIEVLVVARCSTFSATVVCTCYVSCTCHWQCWCIAVHRSLEVCCKSPSEIKSVWKRGDVHTDCSLFWLHYVTFYINSSIIIYILI